MPASVDQDHYRFGGNDGTDATHSWLGNLDTPVSIRCGIIFLLRIHIQETGGAAKNNLVTQFTYSRNGAAYVNVTTTSSVVKAVNGILTEAADAANRLGGTGTFTTNNDGQTEDGAGGGANNDIAASGHTETVCALQLVEADLNNGDTITFRISGLDTYTVTATLTVQIYAAGSSYRPFEFELDTSHPLAAGLRFASLGRFPRTGLCPDSSPYGNHGALTAMEPLADWVWVPRLGRWAFDFDGTNEWVNVGSKAVVTGYPVTFAAWILSRAGEMYAIGLADAAAATNYWCLTVNPLNYCVYYFRAGGSEWITAGMAGISSWTHVAGVSKAANDHRLYVNGVSVGTSVTSATPGGLDNTTIGSLQRSTPLYGNGQVADAMIWNRALSDSQIADLANPADAMLAGLVRPVRRRVVYLPAAPSGNRRRRVLAIGA